MGAGVLFVVLLISWMSSGSGGGSSSVAASPGATSRPATMPTTLKGVLPAEYSILETHNPFGGKRGKAGGPEASLVFKGVIQSGDEYLAFFEDTAAKSVTRKKVGEPVARGRIKSMDLDGLVYEGSEGSKRIEVGQNLNGETPPPPPPPATQPVGGPPGGEAPPGARGAPAARGRSGPVPPQGAPVQMVMPPQ